MPAYSKKPIRMVCRGMNLDRAIDNIPENEFAYLQNWRSYEDGRVESRPGLGFVSQFPVGSPTDYIHSLYTLNDTNPDSPGGSRRFVGFNNDLYWEPITFPAFQQQIDINYSGDPLSMIGLSPVESPTPFLYVGDSQKMRKYSASYLDGGVPYAFRIGIQQEPVYNAMAPIPTIAGGSITGLGYSWRWQLRHTITGARSIPGPPTYTPQNLAAQKATFPDPNQAITGTLALDQQYSWDLYRIGGTIPEAWHYVGSVVNRSGLTIEDDSSDIDIAASNILPTDAQSILYQPFLTQDTPRNGTVFNTQAAVATASGVTGGNGSRIQGTGFNRNWIPGTSIQIAGVNYTISSVISSNVLFIDQDIGVIAGVSWVVDGALVAGTPLSRLFGPYGAGFAGLFVFGVGDPHSPGTLYWMNGNDPDSTSLPNSLDICGPSEVLQNGCIWNGRAYVWSTERMWEIVPAGVLGQFVAQVVPGARGLPDPWAFCVGDVIYFKSKDGIFSFSGSSPTSISDHQLYELLGHDGQNGVGRVLPNPEGGDITVGPPDPSRSAQQRLCYSDGVLYFDYVDPNGVSNTLVYDTHVMNGWVRDVYAPPGYRAHFNETGYHDLLIGCGFQLCWLTGDADLNQTIDLMLMTGADLLGDIRPDKLIGDATVGATPGATPVNARILGARNQSTLTAGVLALSGTYQQTILSVNNGALNLGESAFSPTVGLWIHAQSQAPVYIHDWESTYIPKPEVSTRRATDWTDDGLPGAKYLKAVVIEAAVSTLARAFDLTVDHSDPLKVSAGSYFFSGVDVRRVIVVTANINGFAPGQYTILAAAAGIATLDHSPAPVDSTGGAYALTGSKQIAIQTDGGVTSTFITLAAVQQSEFAYSVLPPCVCKMMRLAPLDDVNCQIFSVRWIWDAYPEYLNIKEDFYLDKWPTSKYVRGVALEGDTQGTNVQLIVEADGGNSSAVINLTQAGKSLTVFGFGTPFVTSEIRIYPLGNWRRHSVRWIFDEYPDYATLITAWEDGGRIGDKYLRGGVIRVDTNNLPVTLTLQSPEFPAIKTLNIQADGETDIPFDLSFPPVVHLLRWKPGEFGNGWRYWKTRWDFDPYPELTREFTAITDLGYKGPKFMQGIRFVGDSNNAPATFKIIFDGGQIGYVSTPASWNGKQTIPFSFPTPFIAHQLQIQPQSNLRTFDAECEWIWEPAPDLAQNWLTQETDHDIPGYHFMRDGWIAYQSAAGATVPETLTITNQYGSYVVTLPVSANYTREYVVLPGLKSRWRKYSLTSVLGARLFVKDTNFRLKPWDGGEYAAVQPFGDLSRAVGARI